MALNLASALKDEGYDIHFVLMQASGEFLAKAAASFTIIDLRCDRTWKLPGKLALYLWRYRPAAVVASFWKLNICLAAARFASPGTAIGLWEHSSPQVEGNSPTWLFAPTATILYRLATCVITVSRSVASDIIQRTAGLSGRIVTIANAIPAPVVDGPVRRSEQERELVWAGRLSKVKNPALMIEAFARLCSSGAPYRLRMIGDGPLRAETERLAAVLGIAARVEFTGFTSDPYPLIAAADLLVMSSVTEGLPTVVIEALYLGINVVATDCGSGIHDILAEGQLGTVVANGDPVALARGIEARLAAPVDADVLRAAAQRYEPHAIARRFLSALRLEGEGAAHDNERAER